MEYNYGEKEDMIDLRNAMDYDVDVVNIIDPEAEDIDELKNSYIGKYIAQCQVCKQLIYVEDRDLTKIENCPYCNFDHCFTLIGRVTEIPIQRNNETSNMNDEEGEPKLSDLVYGKNDVSREQ